MTTEIIVLAAGFGSRLAAHHGGLPKWLLPVAGRRIADRHIDAVEQTFDTGSYELTVVTGHRASAIDDYLRHSTVSATTVYNPFYDRRNNWYSLYLGLNAVLSKDRPNQRIIVLNGDVSATHQWLVFMFEQASTSTESMLVVDSNRLLDDEAMKVVGDTASGRLTDIGKTGLDGEPWAEYVGLMAIDKSSARVLYHLLRDFIGDGRKHNDWYEGAVKRSIGTIPWRLVHVPTSEWTEIDDVLDFRQAEEQLAEYV